MSTQEQNSKERFTGGGYTSAPYISSSSYHQYGYVSGYSPGQGYGCFKEKNKLKVRNYA